MTMPKVWKRWFAGLRTDGDEAAKALQGGIELITPSLIAGWAFHPSCTLSDVRLVAGPHLLAQARFNHHRPDVEDHLQQQGSFGFELEIPADLPLLQIEATPVLLALSVDGSQRFPLSFLGARSSTNDRLTLALQPEFRGLRGHFDGLSPDGRQIHGWCYKVGGRKPARVWLHANDLPPRELICQEQRPGMGNQGHDEICGFSLAVSDWPEAAGCRLWASFDPEGVLRLPQPTPVELPPEAESETSLTVMEEKQEATSQLGVSVYPASPPNQQNHWQDLDIFRQYLDGLERELDRYDQIQLKPSHRKGPWSRLFRSGR